MIQDLHAAGGHDGHHGQPQHGRHLPAFGHASGGDEHGPQLVMTGTPREVFTHAGGAALHGAGRASGVGAYPRADCAQGIDLPAMICTRIDEACATPLLAVEKGGPRMLRDITLGQYIPGDIGHSPPGPAHAKSSLTMPLSSLVIFCVASPVWLRDRHWPICWWPPRLSKVLVAAQAAAQVRQAAAFSADPDLLCSTCSSRPVGTVLCAVEVPHASRRKGS